MLTNRRSSGNATRRRRRLRVGFVATSAASALALGGVALAQDIGLGPFWLTPDRPVVTAVQTDQAAAFAVFQRGARAGDSPTAAVTEQVGNSFGRNLDLSRAIATPTGPGWVIPGNEVICLVIPDPVDGFGVTCNDTETARDNGLVAMMVSPTTPDRAQVTLLTPRRSSARAVAANGSETPLAVDSDGVVNATLPLGGHIALRTAGGPRQIHLPVAPPAPPVGKLPGVVDP